MRLYMVLIITLGLATQTLFAAPADSGQMDQSSFAGTGNDPHDYNGPSKAEKSRVLKMLEDLHLDDSRKAPAKGAQDPDQAPVAQ